MTEDIKCSIELEKLMETRNCITFNIRKTERILGRLFDDILRDVDISGHQFTLLAMMAIKPNMSMNDITEMSGLEKSTISRNIAKIKEDGLIEFDENPFDGRQKLIHLTETGCEKLEEALPIWRKLQDQLVQTLEIPLKAFLDQLQQIGEEPEILNA